MIQLYFIFRTLILLIFIIIKNNYSIRSGSSSIINYNSSSSPLPSPTYSSSSPESNRSLIGFNSNPSNQTSALTQLRAQLNQDEEQQQIVKELRNKINSVSSSSNSSLKESTTAPTITTTTARKLKKPRHNINNIRDEEIISGDTLKIDNTLNENDEITNDEDLASENVEVMKQELDSTTTTLIEPKYLKESTSKSLFLAAPRLTYYLASTTISTSISTTTTILSIPIKVIKILPLSQHLPLINSNSTTSTINSTSSSCSSSTNSNNRLIRTNSKGIKIPTLNELTYSAIEIGLTVGFASVLMIGVGSNLIWNKVRKGKGN